MEIEVKEKSIVISPAAAQKMKEELKPNHSYKIEISAFSWCGPIYRLVQATNTAENDLAVTDPESGIKVYASPEVGEYFQDMEIILASLFSDEVLVVKERF